MRVGSNAQRGADSGAFFVKRPAVFGGRGDFSAHAQSHRPFPHACRPHADAQANLRDERISPNPIYPNSRSTAIERLLLVLVQQYGRLQNLVQQRVADIRQGNPGSSTHLHRIHGVKVAFTSGCQRVLPVSSLSIVPHDHTPSQVVKKQEAALRLCNGDVAAITDLLGTSVKCRSQPGETGVLRRGGGLGDFGDRISLGDYAVSTAPSSF